MRSPLRLRQKRSPPRGGTPDTLIGEVVALPVQA